jgi:hypothetical protein
VPHMTLKNAEYISENDLGRLAAGAVVEVDDETATRWTRRNIATPTKPSDVVKAKRRAELEAELAALSRENASADQFSHAITADSMQGKAPARRGRKPKNEATYGAEIVNDLDDDEDEG